MATTEDTSAIVSSVRQIRTAYEMPGVKITHTILDPGQEIPWHRHSRVTDTFYAVKGPVTVELRDPDDEVVLQPGELLQARVGQPHRVVNRSDRAIEFLLIQGVGQFDFVLEPGALSGGRG